MNEGENIINEPNKRNSMSEPQDYYEQFLALGHPPEYALAYTRQHFPDFTPVVDVSQANSSGNSVTGYMLIVSVIIFMIGFLLFFEPRPDSSYPTDEEVYGLFMLFIGGVMILITGLFYWASKD